jgi:hypothetical protein
MSTLHTYCFIRRRLLVLALVLTSATLSLSAFADSEAIPGRWACIGQGVFGTASDGITSNTVENMRFTADAKGNLTSGIFILSNYVPLLRGETCKFPIVAGSSYKIAAGNGIGTLVLAMTQPSTDEDGENVCTIPIFSPSPTILLNILITKGGNHIFFSGAEDEVLPAFTEGDVFPISGECSRQ